MTFDNLGVQSTPENDTEIGLDDVVCSADTHLLRVSPANFSDGVYEPSGKDRPNPLEISKIAFAGENKKGSARNRNAMLVFFGKSNMLPHLCFVHDVFKSRK